MACASETDQWPDLLPLPMLGGMDRSAPPQAETPSTGGSALRWRVPPFGVLCLRTQSRPSPVPSRQPSLTWIRTLLPPLPQPTPNPAPLQRPRLEEPARAAGLSAVDPARSELLAGAWHNFAAHMRQAAAAFGYVPLRSIEDNNIEESPAASVHSGAQQVPRQLGRPCFLATPDAEVDFWLSRLMTLPEGDACAFWRQIPMYTEYIQGHTVQEIGHHMLQGVGRVPH